VEAAGACERCGAALGGERWCPECGKDARPEQGSLPTPEALEAGRREADWLAKHPDAADAEWEAAHREHEQARLRREALEGGWAPPGGASEPMQPPEFGRYRDLATRAHVLRGWLLAFSLLTAVELALEIDHLSILGQISAEDYLFSDDVLGAESRLVIILLVGLGAYLFATVFFLVWFHRAYRNLIPLGALKLRYGTGWSIGSWFIPLFNLVRPKQIANDIWRASDPNTANWPYPGTWQSLAVPALLNLWWAAYLIAGFLDRGATRAYRDWETLDQAQAGSSIAVAASTVEIISALLCVWVVTVITRRQQQRAAMLAELPEPAPEAALQRA
jgi:Domain of unknown function (DUF4328)